MGAIIGIVLKKAAEGDFGPQVKAIYWSLAGKKTYIAIILAFCAGVVKVAVDSGLCGYYGLSESCTVVSDGITKATLAISGGLVLLGQVDGAVRLEAPKK